MIIFLTKISNIETVLLRIFTKVSIKLSKISNKTNILDILTSSIRTDSRNKNSFGITFTEKSRNMVNHMNMNSIGHSTQQSKICDDCRSKEFWYEYLNSHISCLYRNETNIQYAKQHLLDYIENIDQVLCRCCRRMLNIVEFIDHMQQVIFDLINAIIDKL